MTELIEVLIPRDEWVRGGRFEEFGRTRLLNDLGNKCCLGHMGTACGVADEAMREVGYPCRSPAFRQWPMDLCSASLTRINDARDVPDDIREAWVAEGFRHVGCEAVFVDSLEGERVSP